MITVEFEGQTRLLNPPVGWDQSQGLQCGMLPVQEVKVRDMPIMYSYWEPTPAERTMILQGAAVRLCVVGAVHPPVAVDVQFVEKRA